MMTRHVANSVNVNYCFLVSPPDPMWIHGAAWCRGYSDIMETWWHNMAASLRAWPALLLEYVNACWQQVKNISEKSFILSDFWVTKNIHMQFCFSIWRQFIPSDIILMIKNCFLVSHWISHHLFGAGGIVLLDKAHSTREYTGIKWKLPILVFSTAPERLTRPWPWGEGTRHFPSNGI